MFYDVNELKKHVDNYFCGTLSKTEFGEWTEKAYYDLLKGGYVEIKKIVLYPFLKKISHIHVTSNDIEDIYPCTEEEVLEIQSVLHGEKNFDFQIAMSIPLQVYNMFGEKTCFDIEKRNAFSALKDALLYYIQHEKDDNNKLFHCIRSCYAESPKMVTVPDILQDHIIKLCVCLFDTDSNELKQKTSLKLYPQETNHDYLIEKLIEHLNCYLGDRNFNMLVSYRNGMPDILLLV